MAENAPAPAPAPAPSPAADASATGGARTPTPAPSPSTPAQELAGLSRDPRFHADFSGDNGRPAQLAAMDRKSALTKAAFGPTDAPTNAAPLPEQIKEGLASQSPVERAAAEAMIPGQSPADYSFHWRDAANTPFEVLKQQNALAAEAAFAIGANPDYIRTTVKAVEDMLSRSKGDTVTPQSLEDVLVIRYRSKEAAGSVQAHAQAALNKMPEAARKWTQATLRKMDANDAGWFVGRLASINRANAPKA